MEELRVSPTARRAEHVLDGGGSRGERIMTNAAIGALFTFGDLAKSKAFEAVKGATLDKKSKALEEKFTQAVAARKEHASFGVALDPQEREMQKLADDLQIKVIRDSIRIHESVKSGVEFAEEAISDKVLRAVGDAVLTRVAEPSRNTIFPPADPAEAKNTYVKGTADVLSDYTNGINEVFFNDKLVGLVNKDGTPKKLFGIKLAHRIAYFMNPVNVEAALRIASDLPAVGDAITSIKRGTDAIFESPAFKYINTIASQSLVGFHFVNTREKAVDRATAEMASKPA
jgi:hypothetical protein